MEDDDDDEVEHDDGVDASPLAPSARSGSALMGFGAVKDRSLR
jgi:hypothetical protein